MRPQTVPRSLVWSTSIDVLAPDRVVERRGGYLVVRSPNHPDYYWGNLLLFDEPPEARDVERWPAAFRREFGHESRVGHLTFAWDRPDGAPGAAADFVELGYELDDSVGLVAAADAVRAHPRASRDVEVLPLDTRRADHEPLWDAVVELQVATREEGWGEDGWREFSRARLADLRALFAAGRGTWYVALDGGDVAGSCGVVVAAGRARYQLVGTAPAHRRRGVASRLLVEAARHAERAFGAERFVIVADPGYHALGLYESLGFERAERVLGVCLRPRPA